MSFWDMLMGMSGGPAALATTPHAPHPAAPMGGPVQMQGLPAELPVATPLPPPRPKDQGRVGLDTSGIAQLSADAARYWPETAREIGEAYGAPMGPPGQGFVTPGFIGPMPPVAQRNTPFRNEVPTRAFEGMMDPNSPVGHDEYQMLVRRLFELAQPGRAGSSWR